MRRFRHLSLLLLLLSGLAFAQQADPRLLTLDRIFSSNEFDSQNAGTVRWLRSGEAYTRLEPSASKKGRDLVSVNPADGSKTVLIPADKFVSAGAPEPLAVQNYDWSMDAKKLLIYTNSKKV